MSSPPAGHVHEQTRTNSTSSVTSSGRLLQMPRDIHGYVHVTKGVSPSVSLDLRAVPAHTISRDKLLDITKSRRERAQRLASPAARLRHGLKTVLNNLSLGRWYTDLFINSADALPALGPESTVLSDDHEHTDSDSSDHSSLCPFTPEILERPSIQSSLDEAASIEQLTSSSASLIPQQDEDDTDGSASLRSFNSGSSLHTLSSEEEERIIWNEEHTIQHRDVILTVKGKLGEGGFGVVVLAENEGGNQFAVKVLHKPKMGCLGRGEDLERKDFHCSECLNNAKASAEKVSRELMYYGREAVKSEFQALSRCAGSNTSQFVTQLLVSWEDPINYYFAMNPYVCDLYTLISRRGRLHSDHLRLIAAEMVCGLEGLFVNNVMHHDLKPSNILIGPDGHVAIADFGFCSVTDSELGHKRWTEVGQRGTPGYIAPEILATNYATVNSDIWSFGAILLDMVCGTADGFYRHNQLQVSMKSLSQRFDDLPMGPCTRHFLKGVLNEEVMERYDFGKIKEHLFFYGVNWQSVRNREYDMVFTLQEPERTLPDVSVNFATWRICNMKYMDDFEEVQTSANPINFDIPDFDFILSPEAVRGWRYGTKTLYDEPPRYHQGICWRCHKTTCVSVRWGALCAAIMPMPFDVWSS